MKDIRGRVEIIGKPPVRNRNVPLIDLRTLSDGIFLTGNPSEFGHFYIELEKGERYLDANLEDMDQVNVTIPMTQNAYFFSGEKVALLEPEAGRVIDLATLNYSKDNVSSARGAVESSFYKGLFKAEYSPSYYNGFVDSRDFNSVRFDEPHIVLKSDESSAPLFRDVSRRRKLAIASFGTAGGALVSAITFGALSLSVRKDFENTEYHKPSVQSADKFKMYSGVFWGSVGLATLGILAGGLLLPKERGAPTKDAAAVACLDDTLSLSIGF